MKWSSVFTSLLQSACSSEPGTGLGRAKRCICKDHGSLQMQAH